MAAAAQQFARRAGADPAADSSSAVSPERPAFGVRGGANAIAKAYQFWSSRSAGAAQPSGVDRVQGVEAHQAAAPSETLQATRAAASAYKAAAAYGTSGSYSTSSATSTAEAQASQASRGKATFVAGEGDVVVDIEASESGYDNAIYYSTDNWETRNYIGIDNETQSVNLGRFAAGTEIEFGIENGEGEFFKSGAAALNGDGLRHARVERNGADGTRVSFEDLHGGGDRDFNDAVINVRTVATQSAETSDGEVSADAEQTSEPGDATEAEQSKGDGSYDTSVEGAASDAEADAELYNSGVSEQTDETYGAEETYGSEAYAPEEAYGTEESAAAEEPYGAEETPQSEEIAGSDAATFEEDPYDPSGMV